jgi:transposase
MTRLPVAEHLTPAEVVGHAPAWGRAILQRDNGRGPDALADGRRGDGTDPKLTPDQQAASFAALPADPPDSGLWSGPTVAAVVQGRFGVEVWPRTGWPWLQDLGFRLVVPRPRHPRASTPERQRVWPRLARRAGGRPAPRPPRPGGRAVVRGRGPARARGADRPAPVAGRPPRRGRRGGRIPLGRCRRTGTDQPDLV